MEWLSISLFCLSLIACIALDTSILYALAFGLALFAADALRRGFSLREVGVMCLDGIRTVRNILITFVFIGVLTALWRAAGTIAVIVDWASALIRPGTFLLAVFLLNSALSVLTGTSFGTSATMGVICMTMGLSMGIDARLIGGAVLAGAFFGDRCSPVSTSALLVAELTKTSIYGNIRRMIRSALIPFVLSCALYAAAGLFLAPKGTAINLRAVFDRAFTLHWAAAAPAAVILILSFLRAKVRVSMLVSILTAVPLCLFLQGMSVSEILRTALMGFSASDAEAARMLNGGGILSMVSVSGIICLSSACSGIFQKTGLLNGAKNALQRLAERSNPFTATLCTAILTSVIACNQTLSVILTHQLCGGLTPDRDTFANDLEDTAIVVAPLVPWSIAGAVPLSTIGAPSSAMLFAWYLYLLPLWRLAGSYIKVKKPPAE